MNDFEYEVKGLLKEPIRIALREELTITEDIDSEVDRAASTFGFYAVMAEKAETRYKKGKYAQEIWQSKEEKSQNIEREAGGEKAFTGPQMSSFIKSLSKYHAYQVKLTELDEQRRVMKAVSKSMELKAELVRTKASNRRAERGSK